MADKTFQKKLLPCVIAAALGGVAAPVFADDSPAEAKKDSEVEVLEVRGMRDTLKRNLADKRDAVAVVDIVNAEDIGKFPDKNVAESLQRISGVSIQRQFGEGNGVSVRGSGVDLTMTTLNGQSVASTGWFVFQPAKRSFNYELLPSELVGGLEVYKSSQADLLEGGVGGTVNVKTRKPLKMKANTIYAGVEMSDQGDSGEVDPQYSGMYSYKNDAGSFGLLVSFIDQTRNLNRQGNEAFWQWGAGPVGFEQERNRQAVTGTLQFAPSDALDMTVNVVSMEMAADNTNYALWLTQLDSTWGGGKTDVFLGGAANDKTPIKGPLNVAYYQMRPREATMTSDVVDFELNYEGDGYTVHTQIGSTESGGGTDFETVFDDGTGGTAINNGKYDFTGNSQTWNLGGGIGNGKTYSTYNPGSLVMGTGSSFNRTPKEDMEDYVGLDVKFDVGGNFIQSIKTGFRTSQHETRSLRYEFIQKAGFNPTISTSGIGAGLVDVGFGSYQIMKFDADALKAIAKASIVGDKEDLGAHSEIHEDNFALYAMANFATENAEGNFGVRYIQTDASSLYYAPQTQKLTQASADYDDLLPSFNLKYTLAENRFLRVAASRVIARPDYVDMYTNPNVTGTNDDTPNNQKWIIGNVGLKPFAANQFEVGYEYYFGDRSFVSATVFHKDVENFVTFSERAAPSSEIPFQFDAKHSTGCAATPLTCEYNVGWTVQQKANGESAKIKGVELQAQYDLDNGFGVIANYAYTDSSTDTKTFVDANPVLSDSSKHQYNLVGYYEADKFSVRLAYNWRSSYMLREVGAYGNRKHDDFGVLDLSAGYKFTDNLELRLNVNNITEENVYQIGNNNKPTFYSGFHKGFPLYQYETARVIALGLSARF